MTPKYGQPIKEEPRIARITVNFTVDEKEKLENYCEKRGIKLSELCREEVLKLVKTKTASEEGELCKLRKIAKEMGWKISKGYKRNRHDGTYFYDTHGNKIVGYTVVDSGNAYIEGLSSDCIYEMDFSSLKDLMENYAKE